MKRICRTTGFLVTLVAFLGLLILPGSAFAEAWQLRPTIMLEERFHDNVNLDSETSRSAAESSLKGILGFRRLSETSNLEGRLHLNLSTEKPSRQYLTFTSFKKFELSQIGLDGLFRRDTTARTFNTIADEDELGTPVDPDEGLVSIELDRNTLKLEPNWHHEINERTMMDVGYEFNLVKYENNQPGSGLSDYNQHGITPSISRNLSERDILTTTVGYVQYNSDDLVNTVGKSYFLTIGYKRAFTETLRGGATTGIRHTKLTSDVSDSSSSGFVLQMNLDAKFEASKLSLKANRSLLPSGAGGLLEVSELSVKFNHKFRERLFGAFLLLGSEKNLVGESGGNKRYSLQASPRIGWKITQWWTVGAGYRYQQRELVDSTNDAVNNIVFIQLRYSKGIAI